jgi:hypothetical protein
MNSAKQSRAIEAEFVARIERSEMRERRSRMSLRSIRATLSRVWQNEARKLNSFKASAPAGTLAPILRKLRDEIALIGNDPEFRRKRLIEMGLDPVLNTPEEFAEYLKQDRVNAERVVKESGLMPQ